ncbi:twin-arginine translocase TatA/TatE family subunit [Wenzhouxiangella limi]|uniref:Sec-independent protein translocase protein TatA n=1 Tax=Wenzhouxiangella limi TaxID=2707351 RepID=A0A845V7F0_9GAMM|nr:twin-arginine translocase TatA/TatE family subunit [Wenzhouxiangella limi]NDY95875.1 twin-arginine translocase TatA/TatE family subunit [Wenzhouxiangella limi]
MGFGNIGWFQILVVLLIVLLVFGTKKIRTLGGDLGGAIRDFRKGMSEDEEAENDNESKNAGESSSDETKADEEQNSEKKPEKAKKAASGTAKNT